MNIRIPLKEGNFLTSRVSVGFSSGTLSCGPSSYQFTYSLVIVVGCILFLLWRCSGHLANKSGNISIDLWETQTQ